MEVPLHFEELEKGVTLRRTGGVWDSDLLAHGDRPAKKKVHQNHERLFVSGSIRPALHDGATPDPYHPRNVTGG